MFETSRRNLLLGAAALGAASAASARAETFAYGAGSAPGAQAAASDAAFWGDVRRHYTVTDEIINLENGYWGIMSDPVKKTFLRHCEKVNTQNTLYARGGGFGKDYMAAWGAVAELLGVETEEVALVRGASEACQNLIAGYNRLEPGDQVLYADLDYGAMISAMQWLAERRGVEVVALDLPEPATYESVLAAYQQKIDTLPRLKLVLMTHVTHRTGFIPPVKDVAAYARARGADVILDAAHALGQVVALPEDLGVDFIGYNLHKWIGNPQGAGAMYIRKERMADIDPFMGERDRNNAYSRQHTGTVNMACIATLPEAIGFHNAVGAANKEARLRHLRDVWVGELRGVAGVEVLTGDDPRTYAGITGFRLSGRTSAEDNKAISKRLREEFGILTVPRTGAAHGACIRVTPAFYTTEDDVFALAKALKAIA